MFGHRPFLPSAFPMDQRRRYSRTELNSILRSRRGRQVQEEADVVRAAVYLRFKENAMHECATTRSRICTYKPKTPAFAARLAAIPADAIGYRLSRLIESVILVTIGCEWKREIMKISASRPKYSAWAQPFGGDG